MRQAIGGKLFVLAAEGFGALQAGKLGEAAGQFRKAIKLAPNQASLHYYLALCTGGTESGNAMKRAAGLGYNLARERLRARTTRKQTSR